jgi:hypothetical protein
MGPTFRFRQLATLGFALASLLPACILVEESHEVYEPYPPSPTYTTCFADVDCAVPSFCEELAVPASEYFDHVSAICTVGCFDDLDCPVSDYNLFQGACVDEAWVGGMPGLRICIERCVVDADCDVYAGFGCELLDGQRLCLPVR